MEDIGEMRFGKVLLLLRYCAEAIWCRFRYGVRHFYYIPAPGKRAALYRDWIVMLICRPFFKHCIFHWAEIGLGDWLQREGTRLERWVSNSLLAHPALSIAPDVASLRDPLWFRTDTVEIIPTGLPDPFPTFASDILPFREARAFARQKLLSDQSRSMEQEAAAGDFRVFKILCLNSFESEPDPLDLVEAVRLISNTLTRKGIAIRIEITPFCPEPANAGEAGVSQSGSLNSEQGRALLRSSDCLYVAAKNAPLWQERIAVIEAIAAGLSVIAPYSDELVAILPADYGGFVRGSKPEDIAAALERCFTAKNAASLRLHFISSLTDRRSRERLQRALENLAGPGRREPTFYKAPRSETKKHFNILQVFSRYEAYGGEESSVYRIGDALRGSHNVEYFLGSTTELLTQSRMGRVMLPLSAFHNVDTAKRLKRYQSVGRFDFWQIHNVFPALSPIVYERAFEWGIPIVHYLHNYRLGCTNGFLLNHGKACELCIHGNFWPAFIKKSWRDNRLTSGVMGAVLAYTRHIGLFDKVAQWIAISDCQKAKHVEMGIPAGRIHVIHHFYTPSAPPPPAARDGYALFVGRLSPEKGVAELIAAWEMLGRTDKKLIIAGDGPERARLEKLVQEKSLSNVTFLGFVSRDAQREVWAGAAFSLVPSIWLEPFGMVVLESWAQGRAVIANRIGALPELVENRETGLLAEPFDTVSLAESMAAAFDSRDEMMEMGRAGRRVLEERFTQQQWLERITKVYESL